jgi:hypothetical protein
MELAYPNHLDVQWVKAPRSKRFPRIVFGMQAIHEIPESKFRLLIGTDVLLLRIRFRAVLW